MDFVLELWSKPASKPLRPQETDYTADIYDYTLNNLSNVHPEEPHPAGIVSMPTGDDDARESCPMDKVPIEILLPPHMKPEDHREHLSGRKNMDLFPAHRPGEIFFRHQPAAKLNIFFSNLSRLTPSCYFLLM